VASPPVVNYGVTYPVNSLLVVPGDGTTSGSWEMRWLVTGCRIDAYATTPERIHVHLMTVLIVVYGIVDVMRIAH